MPPIETVLNLLPRHAKSGNGYKANCPAHDDKKPSLSVTEAEGGRVLLHCHAGCTTEAVVEAMGLSTADLFPEERTYSRPVTGQPKQPVFRTAEEAIAAYRLGQPDNQWPYTDAAGNEVGRILRWETSAGKEMRPINRTQAGWTLTGITRPRPLLNLPALLAAPEAPVYVVEGETCVDALESFGLLATTSAGGANAAKQTDWSPLSGRRVILMPDNDATGRKYAEDVLHMLAALNANVSIADLDGLPEGGDVVDLINQCVCDDEKTGLREEIAMLPDELSTHLPSESTGTTVPTKDYQPFPTEEFPKTVADYVTESAAATGCDPAFIALPVLTLLGAAIGNSRRLSVKSTYHVPAILWTGIVGDSGSGKTPALRMALVAASDRERFLRSQEDPKRFLVGDTTTEALAEIMSMNPRGIFCVRDELAGWFGSIDRYTEQKKGCSSDQSFLLSAHEGTAHYVDRRTGKNRHLYIPQASLWVTGGIQPGILAQAMGKQEREAGLLARLLLACPPSTPHKFSENDVSEKTRTEFSDSLAYLFGLQDEGFVSLNQGAKNLWVAFHDQTSEESLGLAGDLAAAWSKFRDTALRIALILHFASGGGDAVTAATMNRALRITRWFMQETLRVYDVINAKSRSGNQQQDEALLKWLADRDWVTCRDVQRGPRLLRTGTEAEACLRRLSASGLLEQRAAADAQSGGRPTTLFRLKADGL